MRLFLISTCTNRKTSKDINIIKASELPKGKQKDVLSAWISALSMKKGILPVKKLYVSRSAAEMRKLARDVSAPLYYISAGLGFVGCDEIRPNYDLTILCNGENSIIKKISGEDFSLSKWWSGINHDNPHPISTIVKKNPDAVIICALNAAYYQMVKEDLERIKSNDLWRLRLLGIKVKPKSKFSSIVLPYDNRFNGPDSPIPGTLSDFPQRCVSHYVRTIFPKVGLEGDKDHVLNLMESFRPPEKINRERVDDEVIIRAMVERLKKGYITNACMLRFLRDDLLLACEQKRCARFYKIAKRYIFYVEK